MPIFALFYYLGTGGVIALITVIALLMSGAEANIKGAAFLGGPAIAVSLIMPVVLQAWKQDDKDTICKKLLAKYVWNCLLLVYITFVLFLSAARFAAFIFMFLGFVVVFGSQESHAKYVKKKIGDLELVILGIASSIWTFLGGVLGSSFLNEMNPLIDEAYGIPILNLNLFTLLLFMVPIFAALVLISLGVLYGGCHYLKELLFNFTDFVESIKNLWKAEAKPMDKATKLTYLVLAWHLGIYIITRGLAFDRDFMVFVTNFQIDNVSMDYRMLGAIVALSLLLCIAIIVGQKTLRNKLGEGFSAWHFRRLCYPLLAIVIFLNLCLPFLVMKVYDPTNDIVISLETKEHSTSCSVCDRDWLHRRHGKGLSLNVPDATLSCYECDNMWLINSVDSLEKALSIERDSWSQETNESASTKQ